MTSTAAQDEHGQPPDVLVLCSSDPSSPLGSASAGLRVAERPSRRWHCMPFSQLMCAEASVECGTDRRRYGRGNDRENDQAAPGSTTGPRPSDTNRSSWSVDSRRRSEAVVLDHIARDVDRYAHGVLFKDVVQVAAASLLEQDIHQGSPRRVGGPTDPVGPPGTVRWLCASTLPATAVAPPAATSTAMSGRATGSHDRRSRSRGSGTGAHHGRSLPAGRRAGA
jgi:hypothetical protein